MSRKRPYMPLFIDRWRGGTESIAPKHRGPYLDLLCAIWNGNGSVRNDPRVLRSASRLDKRQFESFWAECSGKFVISDEQIQHVTVTEMLTASDNFAAKMQQKRSRQQKNPKQKQERKKQNCDYQTKGLVSITKVIEIPNLTDTQETLSIDASPPSPEVGGGDAQSTQHIRILPQSARDVIDELRGLQNAGKISLRDIDQFRRAVQGERAGRPVLLPNYKPPDAISEILSRPHLKAIEGGKS